MNYRTIKIISCLLFMPFVFISSCSVTENTSPIAVDKTDKTEFHFCLETLSINGISVFDRSEVFHNTFDKHLLEIEVQDYCVFFDNGDSENNLQWCEYYDFGLQRVFHDEERTQFRVVFLEMTSSSYTVKFPGIISFGIDENSKLQFLKDVFNDKDFVVDSYCDYFNSDKKPTGYSLHLKIKDKLYYIRFNLSKDETVSSILMHELYN